MKIKFKIRGQKYKIVHGELLKFIPKHKVYIYITRFYWRWRFVYPIKNAYAWYKDTIIGRKPPILRNELNFPCSNIIENEMNKIKNKLIQSF
jgi:hypothetical protein